MLLTQARVDTLIQLISGTFNVRDIWHELDIQSPDNRQHLRVILGRLEAQGLIIKTRKDGTYRKVDDAIVPINWQEADPTNVLSIKLPFGLEEYCKIYPKSIIIVAGEKNAGKTAFLYQTVVLNMNQFTVDLFNSETGMEQMNERFQPLGIPNPAPFNAYERYDNFSDVIKPTHVSVIDYLDFNSEVYLVGEEIDLIFRKKTTGVAIIGLQKPPGRDLAYGGAFSAKRAILYISLGNKTLKLLYVKNPAQKGVNPNNMSWSYRFDGDGYFKDIQRVYTEDNYEF